MRDFDLVDDLLLRNRLAAQFGEQELSLDELQRRHPLVLGSYPRNSLDQRFSRLRRDLQPAVPGKSKKRNQGGRCLLDLAALVADEVES